MLNEHDEVNFLQRLNIHDGIESGADPLTMTTHTHTHVKNKESRSQNNCITYKAVPRRRQDTSDFLRQIFGIKIQETNQNAPRHPLSF